MKKIVIFLTGLLLYGCVTSTTELPEITIADVQPITKMEHEQTTFVLRKVIATIKRGTPVLTFPNDWKTKKYGGFMCTNSMYTHGEEEWGAGSLMLGNWSDEVGEIFYEALSTKGYQIAGDPKKLFEGSEAAQSAEYAIGAAIVDMKGNFCQVHNFWTGYPMGKYSGELYLKIEWTVYSNLAREEIFTMTTEGKVLQKEPKKEGIMLAFNNAFAMAAEQLTSNEDFYKVAAKEYKQVDTSISGKKVTINGIPKRDKNIGKVIEKILPAIATVRVGGGHGSGFFISKDGYLLTNYHVVAKSDNVQIVLNNGLEIRAKVLKRNKPRDVALIKADLKIPMALAIEKKEPNVGSAVIAIGSPLKENLKSTVTKGIVSSIRIDEITEKKFIQSDVSITGGNSGGPLINDNGNVVGISVSGYRGEALNFFIPIKEALEALNVSIEIK